MRKDNFIEEQETINMEENIDTEFTSKDLEELNLDDENDNNNKNKDERIRNIERYKYIYNILNDSKNDPNYPISDKERQSLEKERKDILWYIHNDIEKYIHKIIHNGYSSVINDIPVYDKVTRTQTYSDEYNEAFSEALTAVYEDLHKFDPKKGEFRKFCIARIFHALSEYTCKHVTGKPSKYYAANAKAVKDAKKALYEEGYTESQITLSLLEERTGLTSVMIKNALMIDQRSNFVNIDSEDKGATISSFEASPEEIFFKKEKKNQLFSLLEVLTPLEKMFIYYKFIDKGLTYQEIGCMPEFIEQAKSSEVKIPISSGTVKIKHDSQYYPEYIAVADIRTIEESAFKKLRTTHAFRELYKTGNSAKSEELVFETETANNNNAIIEALMSFDVDIVNEDDFQF